MVVEAICPFCGHKQSVDPAHAAYEHVCDECGESFLSEPDQSELAQAEDALLTGESHTEVAQLACPNCDRIFTPMEQFKDAYELLCAFCGEMMSREDGEERFSFIAEAEETCLEMLLAGYTHDDVYTTLVVDLGMAENRAEAFFLGVLQDLPFIRAADLESVTGLAQNCDLCAALLNDNECSSLHFITWSGANHTATGGGVATATEVRTERLQGGYFICANCLQSIMTSRTYAGYPVNCGYQLHDYEVLDIA